MIAKKPSPRAGRQRGPEQTVDIGSIPPPPPARKDPTDWRWYDRSHPHYLKLLNDPNKFWRWWHNAPENRGRLTRPMDTESPGRQDLEAMIAALQADVEKLKRTPPGSGEQQRPTVEIPRGVKQNIRRRGRR